MTSEVVVLVTVPSRDQGDELAELLVGERLAACVNIVGPIKSVYRWADVVNRDEEFLLVIKSTRDRYASLEARVRERHPYDLPEIIALPILAGSEPYLAWLRSQTLPAASEPSRPDSSPGPAAGEPSGPDSSPGPAAGGRAHGG